MIETNDLNNNIGIKSLNPLIEEYLKHGRHRRTAHYTKQQTALRVQILRDKAPSRCARLGPKYLSSSW